MSSQSKITTDPRWIYDVFLSFSEDTCKTFTSRLYNTLTNSGVHVYMDFNNKELRRGDQISASIIQAIEVSRISVVVFSKSYADSAWCLQELEKIMECDRSIGQRVVPVFYYVHPSDVRKQIGEFGKASEDLKKRISVDKVKVWRAVLQDATYISGFHLHNSRNESKDINQIVENIKYSLNSVLFVTQHPVGVQSRVQDVTTLLNYPQSKDVLLLGIWGTGGLGKTTIAKAIYNQIHHDFEGCCFLQDIRKFWEQSTQQVHLQEQILSDIYKTMKMRIHDIESGKVMLQQSLCHKRILLILDNVNRMDQMEALCGSHDWFGGGSIIIITTRNRDLLDMAEVDHKYEMPAMNTNESIELLSWHAFEQASPNEEFVELSRNVVVNCEGLPLVLEVIGAFLFGKKVKEWEHVVEKLKSIPSDQVYRKLRISFDRLRDNAEKQIFLKIACFFVGMDRNDVIQILSGYELPYVEIGLNILQFRRLVAVDYKNRLGMHELLESMGREIKRQSHIEHVPKIYDVFFSFRGENTRASFTSHLYAAFQNAGIYVFMDNDEIQRGFAISSTLMEAIGKSRISVVVLSKNYANSKWCMQELELIMESRSKLGLVVVPVFYDVDPSDVRNQRGVFGQAFEDLMQRMNATETEKQT